MAIDGHRSDFPDALDSWGAAFENNSCQRFHAEHYNKLADALLQLERHTQRVVLTGDSGSLRTDTGDARPQILVKSWAETLTGGVAETKTVAFPGFTAEELAQFDGEPFAPEHSVHLQVRAVRPAAAEPSYHLEAGLRSPIQPDGVGQEITVARASSDNQNVFAGTVIFTLLITR